MKEKKKKKTRKVYIYIWKYTSVTNKFYMNILEIRMKWYVVYTYVLMYINIYE